MVAHDLRAQDEAEKLLGDPNTKVRAAAALALGNMDARSAADKIAVLVDNPQFQEALAAATALRQLEDPRAYRIYYATLTGAKKTGEGLIASQLKVLHNPKSLAEIGFDEGIGFVPYAGPVMTAYEMITKDDISPLRGEAALWLAYDPDPRSGQALTAALSDKKWMVRAAAAEAIGHRDDPALMEHLPALFLDAEDIVRYTSAAAYLRLGSDNREQKTPRKEFVRPKNQWSRNEELLRRLSKLWHSF
jgi:HEAT repeat protein